MKTIFIATFGTREIQFKESELIEYGFDLERNGSLKVSHKREDGSEILLYQNRNFPGFLCHSSPRNAGRTISNYFELYKNVVHFPLLDNTLAKVEKENQVDKIVVVSTDQSLNKGNEKQYLNDTIEYAKVFKLYIDYRYPSLRNAEIIDLKVENHVVDVDYLYLWFTNEVKKMNVDDADRIILLPQGGIDQINHALTLKLIEFAGKKVEIWQQSETNQPHHLKFTNYFLDSIIKHQIFSLIDSGDYQGAITLADSMYYKNEKLKKMLRFFYLRKNLMFDEVYKVFPNDVKDRPSFVKNFTFESIVNQDSNGIISSFNHNNKIKFRPLLLQATERFAIAEFHFINHNNDFTQFTISFSIFLEYIIKLYVYISTGYNILDDYYHQGKKLISYAKNRNVNLYYFVSSKLGNHSKNDSIDLSFPVIVLIAEFYATYKKQNDNPILKIVDILKKINHKLGERSKKGKFDILRNGIAHNGKGVSKKALIKSSIDAKDISWWEDQINILHALLFSAEKNSFIEGNEYIGLYMESLNPQGDAQ